jgi:hypothetical protein
MLFKIILCLLAAFTTTGCSQYQGWVRYPCQEVDNWENPECQHPRCDVTGTCPEDLLPEVFNAEK